MGCVLLFTERDWLPDDRISLCKSFGNTCIYEGGSETKFLSKNTSDNYSLNHCRDSRDNIDAAKILLKSGSLGSNAVIDNLFLFLLVNVIEF